MHRAITLQAVTEALHVRQRQPRPVINRQDAHRRAVAVLAGVIAAPEGDAFDGLEGLEVLQGWVTPGKNCNLPRMQPL